MVKNRRFQALALIITGLILVLSVYWIDPRLSPVPGMGAILAASSLLVIKNGKNALRVLLVSLAAAIGVYLLPQVPLVPVSMPSAVWSALAAGLAVVGIALLGSRPRIGVLLAGALVPFAVFMGLPLYPEWQGLPLVLIAASPLLATAACPEAAMPLIVAGYAGAYGWPGAAAPAIAGALVAGLACRGRPRLSVLAPLMLALSIPVLYYYEPGGPVLLVAGLLAVVMLYEDRAEALAAALFLGVAAFYAGLHAGLARGEAGALFLAGSSLGLTLIAARSGQARAKVVVGLGVMLLLSAPLVAPPRASGSPPSIDEYLYHATGSILVAPDNSIRDTVESAVREVSGLQGGERIATLLAMDPSMPARVVTPGIVANATIRNLAENTSLRVTPQGPGLLLAPLNETLTVFYGVDPEGPTLRAAVRLPWIVIPRTLVGDELPSPVHSVIILNFSEPLTLRLPGNGTLVVWRAVLGSSFIAGGPRSEAQELPIGAKWTNAVLGVTDGYIVYGNQTLHVPAEASERVVAAYNLTGRLARDNPERMAERATVALYLLDGKNPLRQGPAPSRIALRASTGSGIAVEEWVYSRGEYRLIEQPASSLSGLDIVITLVSPGELNLSGHKAPFDAVLATACSYGNGSGLPTLAAVARGLGTSSLGDTVWLGTHVAGMNVEPPSPGARRFVRPFAALSLLAPFAAAIGLSLYIRVWNLRSQRAGQAP